jgi:hypothetical protein
MRIKRLSLIAVIAAAAVAAGARDRWSSKPWQKWSIEDCKNMLQNSPWAQTWSTSGEEFPTMGRSSEGTGREQEPTVYYYVQLRSALPVREAVARELEIVNKYDKMDPAKQKTIDASVSSYLSRNYGDSVVIHMEYGSNVEIYQRQLMQAWQSLPPGTIPLNTYLITSNGQKVTPERMEVASGADTAVEFIFPRLSNGKPLISQIDKSFAFQFMSPAVGPFATQRAYIEYHPPKMMFAGQFSY